MGLEKIEGTRGRGRVQRIELEPGRPFDRLKFSSPSEAIKIAYIMSRFPKITETFILYEMLALEQLGINVELFPLIRQRTNVMHSEAEVLVKRANFQPFVALRFLRAHVHFLIQNPRKYIGTLWTLVRENLGSFRYFFGALAFFPKSVYFAYLMKLMSITHIHAHFASHPAAAAYVIHQLSGIPYSFTAHGSDLHRDRHMLCEKVAASEFVVSISEHNRNLILKECGDKYLDKLVIIHCGVDTSSFRPIYAKQETKDKPLRIICIGTLHEVKGQTHLLKACEMLQKKGIQFVCNFVGDGPDEDKLKDQAIRNNLTNYVNFLGNQRRSEVIRLIQESDILVVPSVPSGDRRREGLPVVIMEALACEVPVIASRLSGIPEIVEDGCNGYLVSPGDCTGIANALEHLHDNPDFRQKMGREGRKKVISEFDIYQNAAELAYHFSVKI